MNDNEVKTNSRFHTEVFDSLRAYINKNWTSLAPPGVAASKFEGSDRANCCHWEGIKFLRFYEFVRGNLAQQHPGIQYQPAYIKTSNAVRAYIAALPSFPSLSEVAEMVLKHVEEVLPAEWIYLARDYTLGKHDFEDSSGQTVLSIMELVFQHEGSPAGTIDNTLVSKALSARVQYIWLLLQETFRNNSQSVANELHVVITMNLAAKSLAAKD